jgi:ABC-type transport system substrate-binding protein
MFRKDLITVKKTGSKFDKEFKYTELGKIKSEIKKIISPQVDELFKRIKSAEALDEKAQKDLYAELSRLVSEEQPADFLAFQLANVGFQKKVKGIEPGINMGYNYHLWYFE